MKYTRAYQLQASNNKGFLLLEAMVALLLLIGMLSSIAFYQAHTYALCCDAQKRDRAVAVTSSLLERLYVTGIIVPLTVVDGITVTIKPIEVHYGAIAGQDSVQFLEVASSWPVAGNVTSTSFITCMRLGRA